MKFNKSMLNKNVDFDKNEYPFNALLLKTIEDFYGKKIHDLSKLHNYININNLDSSKKTSGS